MWEVRAWGALWDVDLDDEGFGSVGLGGKAGNGLGGDGF